MIKAVIVEDEGVAARRMQRLLEARGLVVIKTIGSIKELSAFIEDSDVGSERESEKADVFFMDIHLSDGVVFKLLSESKIETPIVFTTAYDQYAIKAFKQNSIDYLLKPIDEAELDNAIEKFKRTRKSVDLTVLTALLSAQQTQKSYKERISVRVGDKIRTINISDILFFYSSDKINYLYNKDGRSYPIDYSIEDIHKQLEPRQFYRVSRSYIVAIAAIKDVIAYSNSRLKVMIANVDHEIIVARDRVKDFKEWLG